MKGYSIDDVLKRSGAFSYLTPDGRVDRKAFSLHTDHNVALGLDASESVRRVIEHIEQTYGIELILRGGGFSCTKFDFEIVGEAAEAQAFVLNLLNDSTFVALAQEAKFKVVFLPHGRHMYPIKENDMAEHKTVNVNISNSTVNGVQLESPAAAQSVSNGHADHAELVRVLSDMQNAILVADAQDAAAKQKLSADLQQLKDELLSKSPRKSVVTPLLSNLASIATIATLADQVYKFLPRA